MNRFRNVFLSLLSLLLLTVTGCNSEYDQGYRKGVQDVRDVRHHLGGAGELGLHMQNFFGVEERPDRSEEWSRGYREGIHNELQK
jgi:hypothetical protein